MTAISAKKHSIHTIRNKSQTSAQKRLSDAKLRAALKALRGSVPDNDLEANTVTQGTPLRWILEDTNYTHWRDDSNSQALWISGSPGIGKTKAALLIVRDLRRLTPGLSSQDPLNKSPIVTYHFCDGRDKAVEAIDVLQSLAYTLLVTNPFLISRFDGEKQDTWRPNFESLTQLSQFLKRALSDCKLGTVYFVCAGLNRMNPPSRRELLDIFASWTEVASQNTGNACPVIKLLVLSTPTTDIETALRSAKRIDLEDAGNARIREMDLRAFVTERFQDISSRKNWNQALRYYAENNLLPQRNLEASYEWFELVFAELDSVGEQEYGVLRECLHKLPAGLVPMYDRIVRRISSDREFECIKEVLRCLLVVHAALTLREIAVVADLPGNQSDEMNIRATILKCGGFVELLSDDGGRRIKVRIRSRGIRDYLRSVSGDWLSMDSEEMQHGIVALRCFEYVRVMASNSMDDSEITGQATVRRDGGSARYSKDSKSNTLEYLCTNWIKHAMQATPDIVEHFGLEQDFWKPRSEERREWAAVYAKSDSKFDAKYTGLDIAAYFGYLALAREMLRYEHHQDELRIGGGCDSQSLYLACKSGSLEVARLLVRNGAKVNNQEGALGSPLHAAVTAASRIALIDFLLQHGADVNTVNHSVGSVLCAAVRSADASTIKRLIEKGADVNKRGGRYETPLQAAAYIGCTDKFTILLDMGADPRIRGGYYGSALSAAAAGGHIEIVNMLLDLKQKPSAEMMTEALYTAVHYRQTHSAELLLSKGADVTAKYSGDSSILERYGSILSALEDPLSEGEVAQATYEALIEQTDQAVRSNEGDEDNLSDQDDCSVYSNDWDEMEDAEEDVSYGEIKNLITAALETRKPMPIHTEQPKIQYKPYQDLYAINDDFSTNALISPYFQPEQQSPERKQQKFRLTRPDLRGTTPGPELQQSRLTRPVISDRASSAPEYSLRSSGQPTEEYASRYQGRRSIRGASNESEGTNPLVSKVPQPSSPHKRGDSPKFDFFKTKNAGLPFRDPNVPAGLRLLSNPKDGNKSTTSILDSSKQATRPKPNEIKFYDHHLARASGSPRKLDDIPVTPPEGVTARPRRHTASKSETLSTSTPYLEEGPTATSVKTQQNYATGAEMPIAQSAGLIPKPWGHAASKSETHPSNPPYPELEPTVMSVAPLRPKKLANSGNSHHLTSAKPPAANHQYNIYDRRNIAPQYCAPVQKLDQPPPQGFTCGDYGQPLPQASQKEGERRAQSHSSGPYGQYSPYNQNTVVESSPNSNPLLINQPQPQPSQRVYNGPVYSGHEIGPYTSQDLRPSRCSPAHPSGKFPSQSPGHSPGHSPNIRAENPAGRPPGRSVAQSPGRAPTEVQDTNAYSLAYTPPPSFSGTEYANHDPNNQPYSLSQFYNPPTTAPHHNLPSYRGVIGTPQPQPHQQYRTRKNSQISDDRTPAQAHQQYRQQPYQTQQGLHQQQGQYRTQAPHQGYPFPDQRGQ